MKQKNDEPKVEIVAELVTVQEKLETKYSTIIGQSGGRSMEEFIAC